MHKMTTIQSHAQFWSNEGKELVTGMRFRDEKRKRRWRDELQYEPAAFASAQKDRILST
jgi:hypothetical protein